MAANLVASGEYGGAAIFPVLRVQYGATEARRCMRWLHDYEDWQRGGMLLDGGTEAQPALWLQRCWIIDGVYAAKRHADLEAARKK